MMRIKELIAMSQKNYKYFEAHLPEFMKEYENRYLVIKDETVIGNYESFDEAFMSASETEPEGTFIIQQCVTGEKAIFARCK